jgi:hypothetical protein
VSASRIAQIVPVELLQDDMVGFESELPNPVQNFYGKTAFTDLVAFGEIWLVDCSKRHMWYAGHVRNGQLYLDQSARSQFRNDRDHSRSVPTLIPVGTYKVWLDAWVRKDDEVYASDPLFTKDAVQGNGGAWTAPETSGAQILAGDTRYTASKEGDPLPYSPPK